MDAKLTESVYAVAEQFLASAQKGTARMSFEDSEGVRIEVGTEMVALLAKRAAPRPKKEFDEERTTAYGLLRYANDYLKAAQLVGEANGYEYSEVSSMLIAHSIELSLKAYLRSRGYDLRHLMGLGHRLDKIHRRAMKERIDRIVYMPEDYATVIRILANANEEHQFRYIKNGPFQMPGWQPVSLVAQTLTKSLQKHCLRKTIGKQKATLFLSHPKNRW